MMTQQQNELQELEQIYCELYKDVHGIKARWYRAASLEQARKDLDALEAEGKLVWAAEEKAKDEAAVRFEARVAETIRTGAGDRDTALRWIHQAEGTNGDDEFLCYHLGLRYGYFKPQTQE
jgi:hypothetical protein